jgi:hypothetical protein
LAEHLLYFNVFEWNDVRDDVIGIVVGLLLASVCRRQSVGE